MQIPFTWFYGIQTMMTVAIIIVIVVFAMAACLALKFFGRVSQDAMSAIGSFVMEAPESAIPRSRWTRAEGASEIRTVRLPSKCPSCGATLSPEDIDWIGPLEAKCAYCGGVVHARLERL